MSRYDSPFTRRRFQTPNKYIKREAIYHASSPPYAYPYHQKFLHLRLKSMKNNISSVELIFGDGYQKTTDDRRVDGKWACETRKMRLEGQDNLFDFWFISVEPKFKRCRYFFKLTTTKVTVNAEGYSMCLLEDTEGHIFFDRIYENGEERLTQMKSLNSLNSWNSTGTQSTDTNEDFTKLTNDEHSQLVISKLTEIGKGKFPTPESNSNFEIYYGERGFNTDFEKAFRFGFDFPFVHVVDVFTPPEWAKNAIWYQIFPERFDKGDPSIDPEGVEKWGARPNEHNFFGGDLQGIMNRIPYLVDLGITAIYLTPIFQSNSNHKYNTTDYFKIDEHFGDEKTLRELVRILHENDIKVVFDAVFNHAGESLEQFISLKELQENSPYKDWFFVRHFPITYDPIPSYDCFGFHSYMPKLNTTNPEVKQFIFNVIKYWTVEFGIDGWRLDVSNEIDHKFWREFRETLKSCNSDAIIIGEVWFNSSKWLNGDQFDSTMNYPLQRSVIDFFCNNTLNSVEFCEHITTCRYWYPENVNEVLFNILGSHDTARIFTLCNENIDLMKTVNLFHVFATGTPCIYYGDEIGMTGGEDPDCRKCMEWDEDKHNKHLYNHLKALISIRKDNPSFFIGKAFEIVYSDSEYNYCLFERTSDEYPEKRLFVLINNNSKELNFEESVFPWFFAENSIFRGRHANDLLTKKNINSLTNLDPYESFVFFIEG